MSENKLALFGFAVLALFAYLAFIAIRWLSSVLSEIEPGVGAALIAASATIVSSVFIASLNARRAKEVAAFEAHRTRKAAIYDNFMKQIVEIMRNSKKGKVGESVLPKNVEEFFYAFNTEVTVYGGPGVVKAYSKWRSAANEIEEKDQLKFIDQLFREMRRDLGESNKGIASKELIGLFVVGGKTE